MARSLRLGCKVPNLQGMSKDTWLIICAYPHNTRKDYLSLMSYCRTLKTEHVDVLTTKSRNHSLSIYIVDPDHILRGALHDAPNHPISEHSIIEVMTSLRNAYRPEIQSVDNQPVNPLCSDLEPIVGEYVLGNPQNVDPLLNDFVIYAFALLQPDGTLEPYSELYLEQLANLRFANPDLDVIMAVGGWGNDGFSDAALTPQSRYDFAREVKKWVDAYDLDGVDVDWEYPGSSAAGIKSRPEDRENFTLLLEALRDVLGPDAWISVAGIGDSTYINNVDIAGIAPIIDYFNVMSYDYTAGATGAAGARHHSNLYNSELDYNNISTDLYIQNLIDAGMPPEKLILGVGFYGRNGAEFTQTFDQIRQSYLNKNGYTVRWDDVAKAPYIVDQFGNYFLGFDNPVSIYFKAQYVLENCLGGMFGWQAGMDNANILIDAMFLGLNDPKQLEEVLSKEYYG